MVGPDGLCPPPDAAGRPIAARCLAHHRLWRPWVKHHGGRGQSAGRSRPGRKQPDRDVQTLWAGLGRRAAGAGRGAAVDNAHDWVKEVATEFLPSNDDHGVAVFIDRIIAS